MDRERRVEEFRAAGDGAEFPDGQAVVVDGVVIQDVVLLEMGGVVDKVMVDRVAAHMYAGVCDHIFQVYRLRVPGAGTDLFRRNRHSSLLLIVE